MLAKVRVVVLISVIAGLAPLMLFASGAQEDEQVDSISFWTFPLRDSMREDVTPILESFTEETGIEVELNVIPWGQGQDNILAAIAAGDPPDVVYTTMSRVLPLVEFGDAIRPLDEKITDEFKETYFANPSSINNYSWKGQTYAVPFLGGPHRWGINVDLFLEAGLDDAVETMTDPEATWTWDDFRQWASELTRDTSGNGEIDQWGYAYPGGSTQASPILRHYWNTGGEIVDSDGNVRVGGDETVAVLEFLRGLQEDGSMPQGVEIMSVSESNGLFNEGKVAITSHLEVPSLIALKASGEDLPDFRVVYPPQSPFGARGSFFAWDALAILSEDAVDESWAFIEHYLSSEIWEEFLVEVGLYPVGGVGPDMVDDPLYQQALEVAEGIFAHDDYSHVRHEVLHPAGSQIIRIMNSHLQSVLSGAESPEEAADAIREEAISAVEQTES